MDLGEETDTDTLVHTDDESPRTLSPEKEKSPIPEEDEEEEEEIQAPDQPPPMHILPLRNERLLPQPGDEILHPGHDDFDVHLQAHAQHLGIQHSSLLAKFTSTSGAASPFASLLKKTKSSPSRAEEHEEEDVDDRDNEATERDALLPLLSSSSRGRRAAKKTPLPRTVHTRSLSLSKRVKKTVVARTSSLRRKSKDHTLDSDDTQECFLSQLSLSPTKTGRPAKENTQQKGEKIKSPFLSQAAAHHDEIFPIIPTITLSPRTLTLEDAQKIGCYVKLEDLAAEEESDPFSSPPDSPDSRASQTSSFSGFPTTPGTHLIVPHSFEDALTLLDECDITSSILASTGRPITRNPDLHIKTESSLATKQSVAAKLSKKKHRDT